LNKRSQTFETVERGSSSKLKKSSRITQGESSTPPTLTDNLVLALTGSPKLKPFDRGRSKSHPYGEPRHIGSPTDRDPVLWSEVRPPGEPALEGRIPLRTWSTPTFRSLSGNVRQDGLARHRTTAHIKDRHVPTPKGVGILGLFSRQSVGILKLMSRLSFFIRYRSSKKLDEEMLNRFTQEVGIVSSRVNMWRQRLAEECSTLSYPDSVDYSPPDTSFSVKFYAFICREIQHLVKLTTDLATSIFGTCIWGLSEIEDNLGVLLKMGPRIIYPAIVFLVNSIWRIMRELVDLWREDGGKTNALHLAVEALNNSFIAIQSLIHLGYAYQSMYEPSKRESTKEDLGARIARPTPENMSKEVTK